MPNTLGRAPAAWSLTLVGVLGLIALLVWAGIGDVAHDLSNIGWMLIPIAVLHLGPVLLDASTWRSLTPRPRQSLAVFAMARWVREGVNALLPAAQVGGEIVGVRLLSRLGQPAARAGAIVAIDLATEFLSMVVVGVFGAAILVVSSPAVVRGAAWLVAVAM